MELKVKDFAAQQGVTDSIVYRHIRNHREELGEDVFKKGRSTWLTDRAQEYIKDLMIKQPYALSDTGINMKIYELQEENTDLLRKLSDERLKVQELMKLTQQQARIEEKNKYLENTISNKDEQIASQTAKIAEISLLNDKQAETLAQTEIQLKTASESLTEAQKEIDFYKNLGFFDRIRGKKYEK